MAEQGAARLESVGDPGGRRTVHVTAGSGRSDYPVYVGSAVLAELPSLLEARVPAHRYALISDETVAELHGERVGEAMRDAGLRVEVFTFPAGEEFKTRAEWSRLTDALLTEGFGRDGAVVAVGGGVTGDLAGFVAATYMRGIPVAQIPTSLVAMIDASVGGKTGVDVPAGKNLVGAFHPPRMVVADPDVISTLPRRERSRGLAEAIKHGAILDREYLDRLDRSAGALLDAEPAALLDAVTRSVELKAEVVSRDEREGGLRKILNFGHTVGHAVEAAADYTMAHGAAISVGMVVEAVIGERLGITKDGTSEALARILHRFELPTEVPASLDPAEVVRFTETDKKGRAGTPRYVLLSRLGRTDPGDGWCHRVDPELVREALGEARARGPAETKRPQENLR